MRGQSVVVVSEWRKDGNKEGKKKERKRGRKRERDLMIGRPKDYADSLDSCLFFLSLLN